MRTYEAIHRGLMKLVLAINVYYVHNSLFIIFAVIEIIEKINKAVSEDDVDKLMSLLKSAYLKIPSINKEEKHLYLRMLKKKFLLKESQNLWLDDIIETVKEVNEESLKVKDLTEALIQLNSALLKNNVDEFWDALSCPVFTNLGMVDSSCKNIYFQTFTKALKKRGHHICPWIVCHTDAGNAVYVDIESYTYSWTTPKDFVPYARYFSRKDVNSLIDKTNKHHINKYRQVMIEKAIVKLQAYCRGYLLRKSLLHRLRYFKENEVFVVKIQSWWRSILIRKKYGTMIKMKLIEKKLKQERKQNPLAWYKIQVILVTIDVCFLLHNEPTFLMMIFYRSIK